MRVLKVILLLVISLSSLALAAPNSYDTDRRTELKSWTWPWTPVGLLYRPGYWCTATLIGRDLILTAAHCIFKNQQLVKGKYMFRPNYTNGSATWSDFNHAWYGTTDPQHHREADWAILKLDKPLGDQYGWMGVKSMTARKLVGESNIFMAAYSEDFQNGDIASKESGCTFKMVRWQFIVSHNCDDSPGSSGAAMFVMEGDQPYIVAIDVSELRGGATKTLHGVPYSEEVANIAVASAAFYNRYLAVSGH